VPVVFWLFFGCFLVVPMSSTEIKRAVATGTFRIQALLRPARRGRSLVEELLQRHVRPACHVVPLLFR